MYIKYETYAKKQVEISNLLGDSIKKGEVTLEVASLIMSKIYSMWDDGAIGGYEIFCRVRDEVESKRG